MKALLILIWAGGHSANIHTIWFTDMAACEKAKPVITRQYPGGFEERWFNSFNHATCIEVTQ